MRVVIISHGFPPVIGGVERLLATLVPFLQKSGLEVFILTRRVPNTPDFELYNGVPVNRLPVPGPKPLASLIFTLTALPIIKKIQPDLIHAHEFISPATTALLAYYLFRIPFILMPHLSGKLGDVLKIQRKFLGKLRLKYLKTHAAAFICISKEIDAELSSIGVSTERKVFIRNGVDTQHFSGETDTQKRNLRLALGYPENSKIVIFVARLVPEKNPDALVKIWPEILKNHVEAHLLILGSGSLEPILLQMAGKQVHVLGGQEDVASFLKIADIFVLPSDTEGLPISLLEAMSSQLACLATRVGGIPELIVDRTNGILIDSAEPEVIIAALNQLLDDPELRIVLGQNARQTIVKNYSIETIAAQMKALYDRILENGGRL